MAEGYSFANLLECLTLEAGNEQEVLDYYRSCLASRIGDYWLDEVGPIMSKGLEEEMDAYMENIFPFNGIVSDQRDGINWYAAPDGDLEWNGGFVRHGYMAYLAERYSRTRDERITAKIISDMLDYIEKVPPYDPEGKPYLEYKKSTWRPFEAAGRAAENWPVILKRIIDSASMDAESFCRILYSVHQHAVFLFHHHWKTGNHACLETAGLCVLSVFFPEFRESEEWIRYSLAFLEKMVDEQFYPDGYTREMSGAYHFVAMRSFFQIYEVLSANGRASLVPPAIMEYLGKSALAEFYQMKPDGSLPVTNDSNIRTNHGKYLKKMRSLLPEGYSDYVLSGGKEGRKPARESYMLPDAMLGIMRNGWDRDSVYLDFDMGPWGSNHMNEDQLSVELYAYGKHLLSNCGRWRYTTSPGITWLDKAQYFKTTAAYSSVLCDGLVQNQKGAHGMMESNDAFDYARGLFDGGYGTIEYKEGDTAENGLTSTRKSVIDDAWHKREVVFLKEPALFIVKDTLHSPGMHSLDQIWHFPSGSKLIEGEDLVYEDEGVFLRMKQLMPYSSRSIFLGSEKPFRGWTCPEYNCLEKAYEAEFSFRGENTVKAVTILYPGKGLPELDASIDCADGEDTISIVAGGKLYRVHLFDDIAHCIVD